MNKPTLILSACIMLLAATSCGQKNGNTGTESGEQLQAAIESSAQNAQVVNLDSIAVLELTDMAQMPDNGKLTVIDFNATWCGPCKRFAPTFEVVADEYADQANFVSVDVDKFPELAAKYGVQGIPNVTFIKPDGSVDAAVGLDQLADFRTLVKNHLN